MGTAQNQVDVVRLTDASALARLHAACFERPWTEDSFNSLLGAPGTFALGALLDEAPAGLILIRQAADEAEILTLGVLPPMRRRGVAAALLRASLARAEGVRSLFLEVDVTNHGAIGFYEAVHFKIAGRRNAYYRHADGSTTDALIMRHDVGCLAKD